jgi:hypothetical protein
MSSQPIFDHLRKSQPLSLAGGQWTGTSYVDAYKRNRNPTPNELQAELKNTAWTCASMNATNSGIEAGNGETMPRTGRRNGFWHTPDPFNSPGYLFHRKHNQPPLATSAAPQSSPPNSSPSFSYESLGGLC